MSKKLMVVDDSRIVHAKMKQLLEDTDFEIIGFCRSGEDAIQSYREYRPDVVTMDIVMPVSTVSTLQKPYLRSFPMQTLSWYPLLPMMTPWTQQRKSEPRALSLNPSKKKNSLRP